MSIPEPLAHGLNVWTKKIHEVVSGRRPVVRSRRCPEAVHGVPDGQSRPTRTAGLRGPPRRVQARCDRRRAARRRVGAAGPAGLRKRIQSTVPATEVPGQPDVIRRAARDPPGRPEPPD